MKKKSTLIFILLGIILLIISGVLVYREYSPEDQSAATGKTYYLSPSGSDDSGDGSSAKPWKTVTKANSMVANGDTVIFKDGTYSVPIAPGFNGYLITKSGTTWKAENKHKAILDGGLGPDLFAAKGNAPKEAPSIYKSKFPKPVDGFYTYIFSLRDVSNVTIDGLIVANSPGRGIQIHQTQQTTSVKNITIKNVWLDFIWEHAFLVGPSSQSNYNNITDIIFDSNWITRSGIQKLAYDHGSRSDFSNWPRNYGTAGSKNIITRNNVFAWTFGEIGGNHGSTHQLFENNVTIHAFIAHYIDTNQNVTIRNNLMVASDNVRKMSSAEVSALGIPRGARGIDSVREDNKRVLGFDNKNVQVYNNILLGITSVFSGGHFDAKHRLDGVYIGHNTFIGHPNTRTFDANGMLFLHTDFSQDKPISGIVENNLFVVDQIAQADRSRVIGIPLSASAWNMTARNNLLPPESKAKGALLYANAIETNNSGVVNPLAPFNLEPPKMFSTREAFKAKVDQDIVNSREYVKNLHLKSTSLAVNAGSTGGAAKGVTPPGEARTKDFYGNPRDSKPDIGAIEFGGVQTTVQITPTNTSVPDPSPTPTQPTATGSLTPMPANTNAPSATTPQGNICGKADTDGNGVFTIGDFSEFARAYGSGKNTCADKDVDYGPCGGRDVNRDGVLNIFDFGGPGVGFAQRYYPKTSCAL